jgi:hypothetical protein
MEQKLEGIFALLSNNSQIGKESNPTQGAASIAEPMTPAFSDSFLSRLSPPLRAEPQNNIFPHFAGVSFPNWSSDDLQDVISKGVVDFEQAEESVRFFQTKAPNFPFVLVSPQTSLDLLRREHPFLLLSILAFGAQANLALQNKLELELRESLSKKVIVNGERSLDLLQGLLIYLTW